MPTKPTTPTQPPHLQRHRSDSSVASSSEGSFRSASQRIAGATLGHSPCVVETRRRESLGGGLSVLQHPPLARLDSLSSTEADHPPIVSSGQVVIENALFKG